MTTSAATSLLLFSRGRGRGHAMPDLLILDELRTLCPVLQVEVVSYATGAETFRSRHQYVTDLGLPEDVDFIVALLATGDILRARSQCLVVAHEEPAAVVIAKALGFPTVYMTHWFTGGGDLWSSSLRCADRIVFLGPRGDFNEPTEARGRVSYTGPIVRRFAYHPADRPRLRAKLGIPDDHCVVLVIHGSPNEDTAPIASLVLQAFDAMTVPNKRLVWIAGRDMSEIATKTTGRSDVIVRETDWEIEQWMIVSDVALTKGTYNISLELGALGVPSVSLSNGHNYMDDLLLRRVRSNVALWIEETTPSDLAQVLERCVRDERPAPDPAVLCSEGSRQAARAILECMPALTMHDATAERTTRRYDTGTTG